MTYHEMRVLFERLARYDGRLTVLMAGSQEPATQWGRQGNARWPR